jgi:stalled ribosome rescue protein Dom34
MENIFNDKKIKINSNPMRYDLKKPKLPVIKTNTDSENRIKSNHSRNKKNSYREKNDFTLSNKMINKTKSFVDKKFVIVPSPKKYKKNSLETVDFHNIQC